MNLLYLTLYKVIEYRSGIYDCIQMRPVLYSTSSVCIVTRRDFQFSDMIVLWQSGVNILFIPLSDVTNSEHKLLQFSIFQTMYLNDHDLVQLKPHKDMEPNSILLPDLQNMQRFQRHFSTILFRHKTASLCKARISTQTHCTVSTKTYAHLHSKGSRRLPRIFVSGDFKCLYPHTWGKK